MDEATLDRLEVLHKAMLKLNPYSGVTEAVVRVPDIDADAVRVMFREGLVVVEDAHADEGLKIIAAWLAAIHNAAPEVLEFARIGLDVDEECKRQLEVDKYKAERDAATEVAMTANTEAVRYRKNYVDLCDAVCRESSSVEDACSQARATRATAERYRKALAEIAATDRHEDDPSAIAHQALIGGS